MSEFIFEDRAAWVTDINGNSSKINRRGEVILPFAVLAVYDSHNILVGNEIKTLERLNIIRNLRLGKIDIIVGINLLREGIDIPEVSLICIMDADKQGFLRSDRSLIQTIGRAARNSNGKVIMYADIMSDAMKTAISETARRRAIQEKYNKEHGIIPKTIQKEIKEAISNSVEEEKIEKKKYSKRELNDMIHRLEVEMKEAASRLDFERATELRDVIFELKDLK